MTPLLRLDILLPLGRSLRQRRFNCTHIEEPSGAGLEVRYAPGQRFPTKPSWRHAKKPGYFMKCEKLSLFHAPILAWRGGTEAWSEAGFLRDSPGFSTLVGQPRTCSGPGASSRYSAHCPRPQDLMMVLYAG